MTTANEREVLKVEQGTGGAGYLLKEGLISEQELGEHCRIFSKVTIPPASALGYHEHHGETETYYILKGTGIYNDNGKDVTVKPGDVTFCKDGQGHGLANTGVEDIEFIALILKN